MTAEQPHHMTSGSDDVQDLVVAVSSASEVVFLPRPKPRRTRPTAVAGDTESERGIDVKVGRYEISQNMRRRPWLEADLSRALLRGCSLRPS